MRLALVTLVACALNVMIFAQGPPRDSGAILVPSGSGRLAGIVIDETDAPLRRATVSIAGDMRLNLSTVTDDKGRFAFANLPVGRFTIKAEKAGYPNASYGAKRPNRAGAGVYLTDGQQATDIAIKLARGGVLTGTVSDDRGEPMPGVPVMAWEVRTSLSGERTLDFPITGGESVTSDDQGRYRIYGLPPGEYTVGTAWFFRGFWGDVRVPSDAEIRAAFDALMPQAGGGGLTPSSPPAPSSQMYSHAQVFHPSSLDPMAAGTVQLTSGEERTGVDLRMQFVPMSRIEGTVIGPDGPVANARMELQRRSQVQPLNTTTVWSSGPDGKFVSSSLPPGDFRLRAITQKSGDKPAMFAIADLSIASAAPMDVTLRLEPAMSVTGRFVFEGTALPPPADLTRVAVSLFPAAQREAFASNESASIDPSGTFSIGGVMPSTVRVTANVPNPAGPTAPRWVLKSVTSGGRDVTDLPLDTAPGVAPLTITFTDQTQELSGTLTDAAGKPGTDYFVVVIPADRKYWLLQTRRIANNRPDAQGRFVFRNLPPGDYRLSATTDLVPSDLQDVATLTTLANQSTPISLAAGEKKVFDLRIGRSPLP